MVILLEVEFEAVAVLGRIGAVCTPILVHIRVRLHVTVQHGLVDACIVTFRTLKWLGAKVVTQMILQVVLVFSDEWTLRALQYFVLLDV